MYPVCGYRLRIERIYQGNLLLAEFYEPTSKDPAEKVSHSLYCQKALGKKTITLCVRFG